MLLSSIPRLERYLKDMNAEGIDKVLSDMKKALKTNGTGATLPPNDQAQFNSRMSSKKVKIRLKRLILSKY